ncbi:MAG: efflux RND transporter periplasmic adaptor subunit [Porticoccaceae bacterium]|nr:efflux RND transporter periplasmic adaptor subunit [Porticoccaceae bacterium]
MKKFFFILPFLALYVSAEKMVDLYEVTIIEQYETSRLLPGKLAPKRRSTLGFEAQGLVKVIVVDIGDRVSKGDLLAELVDSEALALANEAKANLSMTQKAFVRAKSLNSEKLLSEQDLEAAELRYLVAKAQHDRSLARLRQTKIIAPYDGIIQSRLLDEGSIVNAGIPVLEILDSESVEAKVALPKSLMDAVKVGQTYQFILDGETSDAILTRLAPMSERGSNTRLGLFEFEGFFNPGSTARLNLKTLEAKRGAWVPLNSLSQAEQGLWTVFTLGSNNIASKDYVELLHIENTMAFVSGTLKTGDMIIIGGSMKVAEGQEVGDRQ